MRAWSRKGRRNGYQDGDADEGSEAGKPVAADARELGDLGFVADAVNGHDDGRNTQGDKKVLLGRGRLQYCVERR